MAAVGRLKRTCRSSMWVEWSSISCSSMRAHGVAAAFECDADGVAVTKIFEAHEREPPPRRHAPSRSHGPGVARDAPPVTTAPPLVAASAAAAVAIATLSSRVAEAAASAVTAGSRRSSVDVVKVAPTNASLASSAARNSTFAHAEQHEALERADHAPARVLAIGAPGDELRQQGVVGDGDLEAFV
jgi:hypothetical protein